jgi:hypothetical protein
VRRSIPNPAIALRRAGRAARAAWLAGAAAALLAAPGCSGRTEPVAPAVVPAAASALQFIADDFPRARDDAKRRHVPIFVEAWAPW